MKQFVTVSAGMAPYVVPSEVSVEMPRTVGDAYLSLVNHAPPPNSVFGSIFPAASVSVSILEISLYLIFLTTSASVHFLQFPI